MRESKKESAAALAETCFRTAASLFTSPQLPAQQRSDEGVDMISLGQQAMGELGKIRGGLAKAPSLVALFKTEVRPQLHSRSLTENSYS